MIDLKVFFQLLRRYYEQQKEYLALDAAEKLTILISAVSIAAISLILGVVVIILLSFGLAFWLGDVFQSTSLGFLLTAAIVFLMIVIFWLKRHDWVLQPIARLMVRVFIEKEKD